MEWSWKRIAVVAALAPLVTTLAGCRCSEPQPAARDAPAGPEVAPAAVPPDVAETTADWAPEAAPEAARRAAGPRPAKKEPPPADEPLGEPRAALGKIAVLGELPRDKVERALRGKLSAMKDCYERSVEKDPKLRGRIDFQLTVDRNGNVSLADAKKSTLKGGDVEICIARVMRDIHFGQPPVGAEPMVSFSIELRR